MANLKIQSIAYIAHDQPDVYETPDMVDAELSEYEEEEPPNECIERLHLSTKDSIGRFKGKYLAGDVDFSDRIGRKNRLGYDARSCEYELAGYGEKETPLQKCHRLKCEMNELMEEIEAARADKNQTNEEKATCETVFDVVSVAKKVLESLKLEQVIGTETASGGTDAEAKKLIEQIEEYKSTGLATGTDPKQVATDLKQSSRVAQLEHRLHQLEVAVGARPERISRLAGATNVGNLVDAVQSISAKAALLQPSQLDAIEGRVEKLLKQMNSIQEKSNVAGQDTNREQKIMELYDIAKSTEPIVQILPDMLYRMQTLESLHKYATNFSKLFAELETSQASIQNGVAGNKSLLTGVQEAIVQNLENVNKEVKKLEDKMQAIEQRIK